MDEILNKLYRGMIHPEEEYQPTEEIRRQRQAIDAHQRNLLESAKEMDPELSERMKEVFEAENSTDALEIEDVYIQGMRMGAQLAMALLNDHRR